MELRNLPGRKIGGYTTFGSVWGKGEQTAGIYVAQNEGGERIPVQSQVMAWWPDGSMKWISHTADSSGMGGKVTLLPVLHEKLGIAVEEEGIGISLVEKESRYEVDTGVISLVVPKISRISPFPRTPPSPQTSKISAPSVLGGSICLEGVALADEIYPVFQIEHREQREDGLGYQSEVREYRGEIDIVTVEEKGPLQVVFCMKGRHICDGDALMPFVIRMYLGYRSAEIRFAHTFFYDGKEERDYLKGMGIRMVSSLGGRPCDKQVQIAVDGNVFHEACTMLGNVSPKVAPETLRRQLEEGCYDYEETGEMGFVASHLPVWNRYILYQESENHAIIKKQTGVDCCKLNCLHGRKALGVMAVSGRKGGIVLGCRDFWQKYPSGLEIDGLGWEKAHSTIWFYSPECEAYDFRHYDTRSYPRTCYEGFEEVGASAYGIGVTSGCTILFTPRKPEKDSLLAFGERVQKPPVYVGKPKYYHEKNAFGYFGLPGCRTEGERWVEGQLGKAFDFYKKEIAARSWYGLFDYGDVMHTYDSVRHCWKYDVGGYAWDNTELVPTYWLWLYFLRTGRGDVFTVAEAMSRHSSEVDVYHFGELKGLGSRHNVRHWGCSCKEPRIAMAGHHRFLYYLTGDRRLGDVFEAVEMADLTMTRQPHTGIRQADGSTRPGIRSGPDWSSFVSNWMTQYERTLDPVYREKIETGIRDIAQTPFGLSSGSDYAYDVEGAHLIYLGEMENTPNQHLQICMGGPQIWWETALMLGDDTLNRLMEDLGAFYFLPKEEKARLTGGKIKERDFSWPMFATGIAGYSAMRKKDEGLALQAWRILLKGVFDIWGYDGFTPVSYGKAADGQEWLEIPDISTNLVSQWALNVMMCTEFIGEYLQVAFEEVRKEWTTS